MCTGIKSNVKYSLWYLKDKLYLYLGCTSNLSNYISVCIHNLIGKIYILSLNISVYSISFIVHSIRNKESKNLFISAFAWELEFP